MAVVNDFVKNIDGRTVLVESTLDHGNRHLHASTEAAGLS
jgi:hypothetical protein